MCTPPSDAIRHELKEHSAFQLHKAVVRHGFREIRFHRALDKELIVVLGIAECSEMEIQQNDHYFAARQRCCMPSALHSAVAFLQISSIFCFKMFAKLVYNTKRLGCYGRFVAPCSKEKLQSYASPCIHHVSSSLPAYIDLILFPYCFRIVSASGSENDRRTIGERYGIDTGSIRD